MVVRFRLMLDDVLADKRVERFRRSVRARGAARTSERGQLSRDGVRLEIGGGVVPDTGGAAQVGWSCDRSAGEWREGLRWRGGRVRRRAYWLCRSGEERPAAEAVHRGVNSARPTPHLLTSATPIRFADLENWSASSRSSFFVS